MEMAMETALAEGHKTVAPPASDEEQRKLCFEMFNAYWEEAFNKGVPFDTIGTMSISAALFALVAKHGPETTAEFVQDLAKSILNDEFSQMRRTN
jgi:hypothetical protein